MVNPIGQKTTLPPVTYDGELKEIAKMWIIGSAQAKQINDINI